MMNGCALACLRGFCGLGVGSIKAKGRFETVASGRELEVWMMMVLVEMVVEWVDFERLIPRIIAILGPGNKYGLFMRTLGDDGGQV